MSAHSDGKISKQLLKKKSGEFDLESIHSLSLQKLGIHDLGCIGECTGLERVDLSKNDVTKLYALASLTNLTHLNLSCNRISSLEGLQALDNLAVLNLAGNLIGGVDTLRCISGLEKLVDLRLIDRIHDVGNPICMNNSYRADVLEMLPNLKILDGERLCGKGSELFKLCAEIDTVLEGGKNRNGPIREQAFPGTWLRHGFWERDNKFEKSSLGDAEQQLESLLSECRRMNVDAEENIKAIESGNGAS